MKLSKILIGAVHLVIVMCITGCNPDDIDIELNVSDIVKAKNGEVAHAKVHIDYSTMDDDVIKDTAKLNACKLIAQKYVGKNGKVRVKKDEMKATVSVDLKAPIYNFGKPQKFEHIQPINIGIHKDQDMLYVFEEKSITQKLNNELGRATKDKDDEFSFNTLSAEFVGDTKLSIHNDTESRFDFHLYGAFVDGEPVLMKAIQLKPGEDCEIKFPRGGSDQIYTKLDPRIFSLKVINN